MLARSALLAGTLLISTRLSVTATTPATFVSAVSLPAVTDVAGPRSDGRLVLSAGPRLYLFDRASAQLQPFAGPGGLMGEAGDEPYIAVSGGERVAAANCNFPRNAVYVLEQGKRDIVEVDAAAHVSRFMHLDGVDSLSGITFDTIGRFGGRLLVIAPAHHLVTVLAIDCRGQVIHVADSAPVMEGGIAVAPTGFGAFAGDLIAADELSGLIRAVRPDGSTAVVADSGLPHGPDTGVEGVGFIPPGFALGGNVYFADRKTGGSTHPGTGSLLAIRATALVGAGARGGDLIAATEGGALAVRVRCNLACIATQIAIGPTIAHGEGHLLAVADHPAPPGSSLPQAAGLGSTPLLQALLARVGIVVVVLLLVSSGGILLRRFRASAGRGRGPQR